MTVNKVSIKVGGEAGWGIMTIGSLCAQALQHAGLHIFMQSDYPSLIKGGHNTVLIRAEEQELHSCIKQIDILIALDAQTITKHHMELSEQGAIIYDTGRVELDVSALVRKDVILHGLPLKKMALEVGNAIYANTIAFGAVTGLLKIDLKHLEAVIRKQFAKKTEKVIQDNMVAIRKGYDAVQNKTFKHTIQEVAHETNTLIDGNEAISYGALKAGCKFYSAYPMTPASSILHVLAAQQNNYNIVVKHTEDELAAILMAIGANYSGVRAMTGTSGGGFSLMTEALGMAGLTEVPLVVVEVQRPGPSTGLPTYTGQGDLRFMLHASQDEFPRVVIAPGDVEECFYETVNAFNVAEGLQVPVIILSDKQLATSAKTTPSFKTAIPITRGKLLTNEEAARQTDYQRHEFTADGISPRALPGQQNCLYVCSSYEHDERGKTSEDPLMHVHMTDKRMKKLQSIPLALIKPRVMGEGEYTIVTWGSTKGPAREALGFLERKGIKARLIHYTYITPFPVEETKKLITNPEKTIVVEGNSLAQFRDWLFQQTGIFIPNTYLKYDGRPFYPEDIQERVQALVKQ
ncbi:MAG: 2-oxoacid:acceptor oxidoreductase subunit alpha [archaeon]